MDSLIAWLIDAPIWLVIPAIIAQNFVVHILAVALGEGVARFFPHRRVAPAAPPLSRAEVLFTIVTLLTNSLTTLVGLLLWRAGIIRFRTDSAIWSVLDILLILLVMDGAMYVLHRIAHLPWIYPWLHKPHHEYTDVRPLTLFILNPLENLAFGSLMLAAFVAYPFTVPAMVFFVIFNVASGILGHLGVEPLPDWWAQTPLVRNVTGGSFHARHHQDISCNFGFYTLIWDRLFKTLRPDYWTRFGKLPAESHCQGQGQRI